MSTRRKVLETGHGASGAADGAGPTISAEAISKSFGTTVAVRSLSFEARSGEIVGLLGPNGAGKTTVMRILSTVLPATSGAFSVAGFPQTRPAEIRRHVGVLPESTGYPLHWTGIEFLKYHARLFGYPARSSGEVASMLLTEVGLRDKAFKRIATYSRGMQQRLGVARALVNDPRVIFLDEPTLGLDPAGQRQMLGLVKEVARRRGSTVIVSTHLLDEVEELCTRVIILNHGAVIAEGSVGEIKRRSAPTGVRVRVAPEAHDLTVETLAGANGVAEVDSVNGDDGLFIARFERGWLARGDAAVNSPIEALTRAGVPVLSLELEGGRLSDAFLALTGEEQS